MSSVSYSDAVLTV